MTDAELSHVEQEYGFEFTDDHRAFRSVGLPLDETAPREPGVYYAHDHPWPNWRSGEPDVLREALAWPTQGILNRSATAYGTRAGASGQRTEHR